MAKSDLVAEYGDFQTPPELAELAVSRLRSAAIQPKAVIEPTCGDGSFVVAAAKAFADARKFLAVDISKNHLLHLRSRLAKYHLSRKIDIRQGDFFQMPWTDIVLGMPEPILIIGNPPWVTTSHLGLLGGSNAPEKSNFHARKGMEALTGKSNFDISEWMILRYLEWLKGKKGIIGVLCKTAVARKILRHCWEKSINTTMAQMYLIDSFRYFGARVESCFFMLAVDERIFSRSDQVCEVYYSLRDDDVWHEIGCRRGIMLSDVQKYDQFCDLAGEDGRYIWRSGLKHDCASVMEINITEGRKTAADGTVLDIEDDLVYPLFKSSDVGGLKERGNRKAVIVTQKVIGEDTRNIEKFTPKTWAYLMQNSEKLDRRGSRIYQGKPRFSVFGVGDYTFAPWKVAISGFYKRLSFKVLSPAEGKPSIPDDTVYFLPCYSKAEAAFLHELLSSGPAQSFLDSQIFWSDKRPITVDILKRLNLRAVAGRLGRIPEYDAYASERTEAKRSRTGRRQADLLSLM